MVQYRSTGSLALPAVVAPLAVAVPLAVATPIAPAAIAFAPAPPRGAAPPAAETLTSVKAAAQVELSAERDRVRALTADLHRLQGQLAIATQPVALPQGVPPQALPVNDEINQGQEHVTPGNPDAADFADAEPTEAEFNALAADAEDNDDIVVG